MDRNLKRKVRQGRRGKNAEMKRIKTGRKG